MLNNNNIEDLFKNKLEGFSTKPSDNLWLKINRKLAFKEFLKFNPAKFNIYYIALITAIAAALIITLNNSEDQMSNALNSERNTTNTILTTDEVKDNSSEFRNEIETDSEEIKNENSDKSTKNETVHNNYHNNIIIINTEEEPNSEGNNTDTKLAKPIANFQASTDEACEPAAITFYNTSENGETFYWEFGNGKTSSLKNPTFVFRTAGTYSVKLTVTSGSISNTIEKKITIKPKPKAEIEQNKQADYFVGDEINFQNNSIDCKRNRWNFGDGSVSSFTNPEYSYSRPGAYTVSLICFNEFNCSDTSITEIIILDDKYKIDAPNAVTIDMNGPANGYWRNNIDQKTVFYPIFYYDVAEYELTIYSKSGSPVFRSNDPEYGWNGYYNNKPVPDQSVYVWICKGKFIDGKEFMKKFNLTVLHSTH